MTEDTTYTTLEDWERLQAVFTTKSAMRPTRTWFNGLSSRLDAKRMRTLLATKSAKQGKDIFATLTDHRLKAMRTYASINHEQAISAFRLTMIANVTVPLALIALANQLIPGGIGNWYFGSLLENDARRIISALAGGLVGLLILLLIVIYALANLNQARDLRHVIDLYAAERGIFFDNEDEADAALG